ncbi:excinuclease ABC subunit UvrC [Rhabdochlamydiaceae symbiont of Dictyostelium giganteum]|uniref:excinuclease ABC subunit UvrC n=1 Tax=Rhabdochlamydiaceae symbiont of Dictyostelium giganteum TaxID=3342349 RepID=UPI00384B065C
MPFFDPKVLDKYTTEPGVYLMKNADKKVIYVGKAKNIKVRLKQYFAASGDGRPMIPFLIAALSFIDIIVTPSEKEALLLENTLIKKHQPQFNACLKDDKTFVTIMINPKNPWPRIRLMRTKERSKGDGLYFGPYTNAYAARQTVDLMARIFPLRQCSDEEFKRRSRPCLLHGIKRCLAPCTNLCTKEEYGAHVKNAILFLKGQDKVLVETLKKEMQEASDALLFERAGEILNQIEAIQQMSAKTGLVAQPVGKDTDVLGIYRQGYDVVLTQLFFRKGNLIGSEHYTFSSAAETDEELLSSFILQFYQNKQSLPEEILVRHPLQKELQEIINVSLTAPQKGEKKLMVEMAENNAKVIFEQEKDEDALTEAMLLNLQETAQLSCYPSRIECFDTSNIAGADLVASMVAFTDGVYDKKASRLFNIKTVHTSDDYAALHEVLRRRLTRLKEENNLPDLIIVDGGKGQLGIGVKVLEELNIATVDIISLAKEESRHDKGLTRERIFIPSTSQPITLPLHSPLLFFLQRIRDETHRRAISFHRKQRKKRLIKSAIDELPGIGPQKKQRLFKTFGSLQRILEADPEALKQVKGITAKDITTIQAFKDRFPQ